MRGAGVSLGVATALLLFVFPFTGHAQDGIGPRATAQPHAAVSVTETDPDPDPPAFESRTFHAGGLVGYENGLGFQGFLQIQDFAQGFPLKARLRLGWAHTEPGIPLDARRVFINDATNGSPREKGRTLDMAMDGLIPWKGSTHLYGGVRYTRFLANFNFVGGNEDFDVTSSHWGLGMGMEGSYPMGARTALVVTGGGEYFFAARLTGHDTSYSPDGDHVNPRQDYGYDDADEAVKQPRFRPVLMMGISYRLNW